MMIEMFDLLFALHNMNWLRESKIPIRHCAFAPTYWDCYALDILLITYSLASRNLPLGRIF